MSDSRDHMKIIYCPCPSDEVAEEIGTKLLENGLIGCANILPKVKSIYFWANKINKDEETLLLLKFVARNESMVRSKIERLHPYEIPCIVTLHVENVNEQYFQWLLDGAYGK